MQYLTKTASYKMKRILLVDDESDVCFMLEKVLGENGFVVDSYEIHTLALEKFKAHSDFGCRPGKPDADTLQLLSLELPG